MFKIESVTIDGFWQSKIASSVFKDDVNIIIGKNGTGKTTFMNILHAVLAVDIDALCDNSFNKVKISLTDGKRKRTVQAQRIDSLSDRFPLIEYQISKKHFIIILVGGEDNRVYSPSFRRRAHEEAQQVRQALSELVSIASLSVYRLGGDIDPEQRDRIPRKYASTVDLRLSSLMQRLTQYQLELSNQARVISSELQRDVLTSLLFSEQKENNLGYKLDFSENEEKQNLISAYKQLGVSGPDIAKKIQYHVSAVAYSVAKLKSLSSKPTSEVSKKI